MRKPLALLLILALGLVAIGSNLAQQPGTAESAQKYALIVGCTRYPYCESIHALNGPANDSRMWKSSLARFGFEPANVESLVGWPDDSVQRPTCANITQAFERLIKKAGPGIQFFILISGHGTQVPAMETAEALKNPALQEHDGLDEVFLPADAKSWHDGRLENSIRDDQFGAWLQQFRDRGADVWIVFDCCHSGTMTRGEEVMRSVNAVNELGVPAAAMEQAKQKAVAAQAKAAPDTLSTGPAHQPGTEKSKGSVVALYAAQPFEETPELPRPGGVKRAPENYFGLLTYTVNQVMEQRRTPISYRELMRLVMASYCSERGTRGPTPFAEGDLDREVLGQKVWPNRAEILLQVNKRELHLTAGQLQGLQTGSILAVHPAPGAEAPDTVLGHVRVVNTTPTNADVEVCEFAGRQAVDAARLPNLARCHVVYQDLGDSRIRLAADNEPRLTASLDLLPESTQAIVARAVDSPWKLRIVPPEKSPELLDRKRSEIESLFKVRGDTDWAVLEYTGNAAAANSSGLGQAANSSAASVHHILAVYPAGDTAALGKALARDLPKLYAWQNIWRVSGLCSGSGSEDSTIDVKLHIKKLKNADDTGEGEPVGAALAPGDVLKISLENKSRSEVWVSLLFLDARLGIMVESLTLQAYESTTPRRFAIFDNSFGPEGFVIFAGKLRSELNQGPNLMMLAQPPLGEDNQSSATRGDDTPFGRLLEHAARGQGGTRGSVVNDPGRPVASACTWLTIPKGK